MNNPSSRLVLYLLGGAAIFVICFGIRGLGLHHHSDLWLGSYGPAGAQPPDEARHARLAGAGAEHLDGRPAPGLVIATVFSRSPN